MSHTEDEETDDRPLSQVLEDLGARDEPKLYLGELVNAFGERGFGALLFLLGLISAVIGAIPGMTTVLGVPMLLVAVQLILRRDQLWLPQWALTRHLDRHNFAAAVAKTDRPLKIIERVSSPRLEIMNSDLSEMLIGLVCAILALILMLPLIGFNLVPSLIVMIFGFGMTQRDGVFMLVGWLGTAGFSVFAWLFWEVVSRAVMASWQWATQLF